MIIGDDVQIAMVRMHDLKWFQIEMAEVENPETRGIMSYNALGFDDNISNQQLFESWK